MEQGVEIETRQPDRFSVSGSYAFCLHSLEFEQQSLRRNESGEGFVIRGRQGPLIFPNPEAVPVTKFLIAHFEHEMDDRGRLIVYFKEFEAKVFKDYRDKLFATEVPIVVCLDGVMKVVPSDVFLDLEIEDVEGFLQASEVGS
jgi:hypothetical protein